MDSDISGRSLSPPNMSLMDQSSQKDDPTAPSLVDVSSVPEEQEVYKRKESVGLENFEPQNWKNNRSNWKDLHANLVKYFVQLA